MPLIGQQRKFAGVRFGKTAGVLRRQEIGVKELTGLRSRVSFDDPIRL
jgi:hypothetical protein